MLNRIVCAALAALLPLGAPQAADLAREPVVVERKCNLFTNYFIYGDPRDCPNDETVPACESPSVVKATLRFLARAEDIYRVPDVQAFERPRELPEIYTNPSELVRRYCAADVVLTNGDHTTVYYFVEEDSGFVGIPWSVNACILGYDPWRVYDGMCRVAQPSTYH